MLSSTEMQAFVKKINLTLFNDLFAFILDTAKADHELQWNICHSCILADVNHGPGAIQEKTGFLYLGELLERYEERFGMPEADLRAIALALAFTRDLLTANMFVGRQKEDFLDKVKLAAKNDIFLTGALFLLEEGTSDWEQALWEKEYGMTEDLVFALGLFPDFNGAFDHFKPQLLRLLGSGRTVPVLGNAKLIDWFASRLITELKGRRGKDMALFRALCELPVSYVKPGSKPYEILTQNGYSPLEIACANMLTVQSQEAAGVISLSSVLTEKIAVRLFVEVLSTEETVPQEIYRFLAELYPTYAKFRIKCYGEHELLPVLEKQAEIRTPEAFICLAGIVNVSSLLFDCFDVLDSKWDKLARELPAEQYREVFCGHLNHDMNADELRTRIARYDALTGTSYVEYFYEGTSISSFGLLVEKGVIDLWQAFSESLDENGTVVRPVMLKNISRYIYGTFTLEWFRFLEKFLEHHEILDLHRFFPEHPVCFFEPVVRYSEYENWVEINFNWEFLDDGMRRQLLGWVQEYIYLRFPMQYTALLVKVLFHEPASKALSWKEQRAIFDFLLENNLFFGCEASLKQRYFSQEELEAEQKAKEAEQQEHKRQKEAQRLQGFYEEYAKTENSFGKIRKYIESNRYFKEDSLTACTVVHEHLDSVLAAREYSLDSFAFADFLQVCGKLAEYGVMDMAQAQEYIRKIKEDISHDKDNDC